MGDCIVDFQAEGVNVENHEGVGGVLDGVALLCGESWDEESAGGVPDVQACGGVGVGGADADGLGKGVVSRQEKGDQNSLDCSLFHRHGLCGFHGIS